jgi:uncharacterized protein YlxW (UPF0749 family)
MPPVTPSPLDYLNSAVGVAGVVVGLIAAVATLLAVGVALYQVQTANKRADASAAEADKLRKQQLKLQLDALMVEYNTLQGELPKLETWLATAVSYGNNERASSFRAQVNNSRIRSTQITDLMNEIQGPGWLP